LKVLFVNPPQMGIFSEGLQPLGIAMLAGVLTEKGCEVRIKDYTVERFNENELAHELKTFCPDVTGVTITTPVADFVYQRIVPVVRRNSSSLIIAGGPHPTSMDEESAMYVDIVVRGEGEETVSELFNKLDNPSEIKGITFMKNGVLKRNPNREPVEKLDSLPFPMRDLLPPIERYRGLPSVKQRRVYNISTSRGCPYKCVFCFQGIFGRRFRARSPESVLEEWELLVKKYRAEVITISDDTFTTDAERVEEICRGIIKRGLKIPWTCSNGIRINRDTVRLLPLMKEAGCIHVAFGIESGTSDGLKRINKDLSLELIVKTVKKARETGIRTLVGFFIIGFPWEDEKAILETISFATSLPLDYAHFTVPIPFPGTELYEIYIKEGNKIPPYECFYPHSQHIFFNGKGIDKARIKLLYKKAYREFYIRPGIILSHFLRSVSSYRLMKRYLKEIFYFFF